MGEMQGIEIRQLTTEDMVSFQCAMASYKTMGQQMLDVFNSITRDLLSRLPKGFTYHYCEVMMTNHLENYGDGSCVAFYTSVGKVKPVWRDWNESGGKVHNYVTATRREVIEVIRQFKPFLEQLCQELSKDNNEIADHVKRLKAIWAEVSSHEE
jgi:hypothetical protein